MNNKTLDELQIEEMRLELLGNINDSSQDDLFKLKLKQAKYIALETIYQFNLSNHFANLVCGTEIASINPISNGKDSAFVIVLDGRYRSYMEGNGQEAFED